MNSFFGKHFASLVRLVACVLGSIFALGTANAVPICIPQAGGVPALSGAPNWLTGTFPTLWDKVDDPRWRGAASRSLGGGGAAEHVSFRVIRDGTALYLQWDVKVSPAFTDADAVYVAFSPGGVARDQVLVIYPNDVPGGGGATSQTNVPIPEPGTIISAVRTAGAWNLAAVPAWVEANTRVSRDLVHETWSINMKVPISGDPNNLDSGISFGNAFKIWYQVAVAQDPTTLTNYRNSSDATHDYSWIQSQLDSTGWEDFDRNLTSNDPLVCARDVSLLASDVGSKYVDGGMVARPNRIRVYGTNTLYAHPKNERATEIAANQICATFRVANWGTQPDWNAGVAADTLWKQVSNACPLGPRNPGPIAAGTKANIASGATQNEIVSAWALTDEEKCQFTGTGGIPANQTSDNVGIPAPAGGCPIGTPVAGVRRLHQCMLVELSGGGLTYSPASVYRNMDFVRASTFTREAEISVAGLPTGGDPNRDVYLFVKTYNLPADVNSPGPPDSLRDVRQSQEYSDRPGPNDNRRVVVDRPGSSLPTSEVPPLGADFNVLNQLYPTYVVHAYHDTGVTEVIKGKTYKLLKSQSSFGYYINHEGEESGWEHRLEGAQQIAPHLYLIAVPDGGKRDIVTTIEAKEFEGRFAIWLGLGSTLPHGAFGNSFDEDFAATLGIEYALKPNLSLEGTLGLHQFSGNGTSDLDVIQFGVNGKFYFGSQPAFRPFVTAGIGGYAFDPGSTEFGYNVGVGVQIGFSSRWSIEGRFDYHDVSSSPSAEYSTLLVAARYAF